jgi:hypothetical protein
LTEAAVIDSARRIGVVIHAVRVAGDPFLDRLAEAAGGRTWSATSDRQLRKLFTRALDEMRARYLLTYTPSGVSRPGWHELKVKLKTGGAGVGSASSASSALIVVRRVVSAAATSPCGSSPRP